VTALAPYPADTARPVPVAEPWHKRRIMVTPEHRFIREVDAIAEVKRLNVALETAQADSAAAFSLAEQMQRELDMAKLTIETLRALATIGLNRELAADPDGSAIPSDAQAEAQAWLQNYNDLERKAAEATADQAMLAFLLSSFQSADNDWHWLHVVLKGATPRAAVEAAILNQPQAQPTGMIPNRNLPDPDEQPSEVPPPGN
jgi:hypothetical protein